MINLDQITERGVRLDLQGLIILKTKKETWGKKAQIGKDGNRVSENDEVRRHVQLCFEFIYTMTHVCLFNTRCVLRCV